MPGENACDAGLNTHEEMHHFVGEVMDKISVEISDHFSRLWELKSHFGFLCNAEFLETRQIFKIMNSFLSSKISVLMWHTSIQKTWIDWNYIRTTRTSFPSKQDNRMGKNRTFLQRKCSNTLHPWDWRHIRRWQQLFRFCCYHQFQQNHVSILSEKWNWTNCICYSFNWERNSFFHNFSDVIKDFAAMTSRKVQLLTSVTYKLICSK